MLTLLEHSQNYKVMGIIKLLPLIIFQKMLREVNIFKIVMDIYINLMGKKFLLKSIQEQIVK
jgi:hypothetical protein